MDQKFIEPVLSLENPFKQDPLDTMSAYHCREQCMNTEDCNSFSWQYDKSFGNFARFTFKIHLKDSQIYILRFLRNVSRGSWTE